MLTSILFRKKHPGSTIRKLYKYLQNVQIFYGDIDSADEKIIEIFEKTEFLKFKER